MHVLGSALSSKPEKQEAFDFVSPGKGIMPVASLLEPWLDGVS
jgi:hypothetical protein